ncbi:SRPBCC family protein [Pigmentibacter ruber]|uniref:SRPBCC family protein n=1 Tax=Pigmentibacter ruber TaxID=2683196 RepID=UPI00131DB481|nr:SRPBCC family protein [Pigmentibacter ruber]BFD32287.1 hypothetical protein GTC16762_19050 [Pigmentibacter ruber]
MTSSAENTINDHVLVYCRPELLYKFWLNLENLPLFMEHLKEVRKKDELNSTWTAKAPLGASVSWEATIMEKVPNEKIVWQSLPNSDVYNYGRVSFKYAIICEDPLPIYATLLEVFILYKPPLGTLGEKISSFFGENPKQQISIDLKSLKEGIENNKYMV